MHNGGKINKDERALSNVSWLERHSVLTDDLYALNQFTVEHWNGVRW